MDGSDLISLYRSCHYFYDMLRHSATFWKLMCTKEELINYEILMSDSETLEDLNKIGWAEKSMRIIPPDDYEHWRKVFLRGLQMRRNIIKSNFEGEIQRKRFWILKTKHSKTMNNLINFERLNGYD